MPSIPVILALMREFATLRDRPRTPEPDLVMDDPAKVAAYTKAGRADGVMAPVYLFHAIHICQSMRPGDTVLDLACGPATQLAMVAKLNPDCTFVGVDLSNEMLERAQAHIDELGLTNVSLKLGDVSSLDFLAENSVDVVMSTMAFHHLPNAALLDQTFSEIARVLRPAGGVYIADFGKLKSESVVDYFAHQYADRQPELFTLDYLYSLRAAFSLGEFKGAASRLKGQAQLFQTFLIPYMITVKSRPRSGPDTMPMENLRRLFDAMPQHHKTDFKDLVTFFRLGGLKTPKLSA